MAAVFGLFRQNLFLSHCCKAFAAVNRSVVRGSKGNLCFLAALCADCGVHFSGSFGSFLLLFSARLASLGLVLESARRVKFPFHGRETDFCPPLFEYKSLVLVPRFLPRLKKNKNL